MNVENRLGTKPLKTKDDALALSVSILRAIAPYCSAQGLPGVNIVLQIDTEDGWVTISSGDPVRLNLNKEIAIENAQMLFRGLERIAVDVESHCRELSGAVADYIVAKVKEK